MGQKVNVGHYFNYCVNYFENYCVKIPVILKGSFKGPVLENEIFVASQSFY